MATVHCSGYFATNSVLVLANGKVLLFYTTALLPALHNGFNSGIIAIGLWYSIV